MFCILQEYLRLVRRYYQFVYIASFFHWPLTKSFLNVILDYYRRSYTDHKVLSLFWATMSPTRVVTAAFSVFALIHNPSKSESYEATPITYSSYAEYL